METLDDSERHLIVFEQHDYFCSKLKEFLSLQLNVEPSPEDGKSELVLIRSLTDILDEYQEQAYLLDPYLHELVEPLSSSLRDHVQSSSHFTSRIGLVSHLIYHFTKVRGHKTVVRFFSHEVGDLIPLLYTLSHPEELGPDWEFRYVLFLWLSLVCMIPFDMSKFNTPDGQVTAEQVQQLATQALYSSGIERDAAAHLLGRFLLRRDTIENRLPSFLDEMKSEVEVTGNVFLATGVAQTLCQIVKHASLDILRPIIPKLYSMLILYQPTIVGNTSATSRQFGAKLSGRLALLLLPSTTFTFRRGRPKKALGGKIIDNTSTQVVPDEEDIDVPEQVEAIIQDLLESLQDKDTDVRWSSAKYLARIGERLPSSFSSQIIYSILDMFSRDTLPGTEGMDDDELDLSGVEDRTWQGACLAMAEFTRRGVLNTNDLGQVISWIVRALSFDQRRRKKPIGINIRDSAAYVIWAMARSFDPKELEPYIVVLAQSLVVTSMYDREIHIRRAASAAFQELVGRQGTVPNGIDVLREADFLTVSVRRKAFINTSKKISKYPTYRSSLLSRLLDVTIYHWDDDVRILASSALAIVLNEDNDEKWFQVVDKLGNTLQEKSVVRKHGALEALQAIVLFYKEESDGNPRKAYSSQILKHVETLDLSDATSSQESMLLISICNLIQNSASTVIGSNKEESIFETSEKLWSFIDTCLSKPSENCHKAAAQAIGSISSVMVDVSTLAFKRISGIIDG